MKRLVLVAVAVATGVCLVVPASAEPRQSATGAATVTMQLTESGDSLTWGPWQLDGTWRTDDGATLAGSVLGSSVTTAPPTPAWVIPDFTISGSNATGALDGTCTGTVVRTLPRTLEIDMHCVLSISGAALRADDSETLVLTLVSKRATPNGDVLTYRGAL
jgi:hypothetical protein